MTVGSTGTVKTSCRTTGTSEIAFLGFIEHLFQMQVKRSTFADCIVYLAVYRLSEFGSKLSYLGLLAQLLSGRW